MSRRLALVAACLAGLLAAPGALAAPQHVGGGGGFWAQKEVEAVVAAGLMAPSVAEFRPNDLLTGAELAELLAGLAGGAEQASAADPAATVTLTQLDAALVRAAGLDRAAKTVQDGLAAAGLTPPPYAGTETVARLLKLRLDHPQTDEALEVGPADPVSRAEAAYSVARLLEARASGWRLKTVMASAASFVAPELSDWQRRILTKAVSLVGYPYVWAGTSEEPQAPLGKPVPGGFDCSGFVWRVFKLESYPGAPSLGATLEGRTTYAMSGEVGPELRIPFDELQPADLFFSGDAGPRSKPAQIGHMGIVLGNGWIVHSSGSGVTLVPIGDYYRDRFAWGRRPLSEAGLA